MVISASRRTDIPAYYSDWFFNRVQAGYCCVPNPFNPKQVSRVSLLPAEVDCIAFWTRNPRPMLSRLHLLDENRVPYYFMVTLMEYSTLLEPDAPPVERRIEAFKALSDRIDPEHVVWRYDPILFTPSDSAADHAERFSGIAAELDGYTHRVIVSGYDAYRKAEKKLPDALKSGRELDPRQTAEFGQLLSEVATVAGRHGMRVTSCAERFDTRPFGIEPGACIDSGYINETFGLALPVTRDRSQRKLCRCAPSRDIGMYDTCPAGCRYCYASGDRELILARVRSHDPEGESLLPGFGHR